MCLSYIAKEQLFITSVITYFKIFYADDLSLEPLQFYFNLFSYLMFYDIKCLFFI